MTQKALEFLERQRPETPCLVVDIDAVESRYRELRHRMPLAEVFYAVKANPAEPILARLADLGSNFDAASTGEIRQLLALGVEPARISFGNTIKKQRDIAWAYSAGVRLFAFDSEAELRKLAADAPGAQVFCRILTEGKGALWPLNRKFGCEPTMAAELLILAQSLGLAAAGVSFHVGSQQLDPMQWDSAIAASRQIFDAASAAGVELDLLDLGGGFPATYDAPVDGIGSYADTIMSSLSRHFGNRMPRLIIEPGRYMVGDAGVLEAEVVLISSKSRSESKRWVYLDIGRFGGLAEVEGEGIRYRIQPARPIKGKAGPVVLAGPTCDSADVLYDKAGYQLPLGLRIGDRVRIYATGAYTTTYSAVNFNGIDPLTAYYI